MFLFMKKFIDYTTMLIRLSNRSIKTVTKNGTVFFIFFDFFFLRF